MPRCVQNFWVSLEVDGKKEKIATGPRNAGGGFQMRILMRENGDISDDEVVIVGRKDSFGNLILSVDMPGLGTKTVVKRP